jgi:hypothetical protein
MKPMIDAAMSWLLVVAPGGLQGGLGVAGLVEGEAELLELLAGELAGALGDHQERRQVVHVVGEEAGEALEVVAGLLALAVAALDAEELVGVVGDDEVACHRRWSGRGARRPRGGPRTTRRRLGGVAARSCWTSAAGSCRRRSRSARRPRLEAALLAWSLATIWSTISWATASSRAPWRLLDERGEGRFGIDDHRLHGAHVFEGAVEVDGVEDAEDLLADLVAAAGRAAEHLLVEDAAADAAQEDDVGDPGARRCRW